jgi:hypothetical protein
MDAATAYGANRWLLQLHEKPEWPFREKYDARDDENLFYEFVHDLILYDNIWLDNTCGCILRELRDFFDDINYHFADSERELITLHDIATADPDYLDPVMRAVTALVAEQSYHRDDLLQHASEVPWAYHGMQHRDASDMSSAAEEAGLDQALLPLALFLFRGLCYAGFANNLAERDHRPVAYVASPGRMRALELVMSRHDIERLEYPREAYSDLVRRLKLPSRGYDFSFLETFSPAVLSPLTLALRQRSPQEALHSVLLWRNSEDAKELREAWAERIFGYRFSAAIGTTVTQNIINSHIGGNVQQVMRGVA